MPAQYGSNRLTTRSIFKRVLIIVSLLVLVNECFSLFGPFAHSFDSVLNHILENICLIAVSGPLLWFAIARPLQRTASYQQARMQLLLTEVVEAIITLTPEGIIIGCNPSAERIFAASCNYMVGKNAGILFEGGEAVCRLLLDDALTLRGNSGGGAPYFNEIDGLRQNGSTFVMEASFSPVTTDGNREIILLVRDISDRLNAQKTIEEGEVRFNQIFELAQKVISESEVRFRQIFEQSADAIFLIDAECRRILDLNQVAVRLFGYTKEELINLFPAFLFSPEEQQAIFHQAVELQNSAGYWVDRMHVLRKDGTELYISVRCRMIELGDQSALLCTVRDISERVQIEKEARDIEAKLIQANKMTSLGVLVTGIAHEINNPNNFIMLSSEMLSRSWKDARPVLVAYHEQHPEFSLGGVAFDTMEHEIPNLMDNITEGARRIRNIVRELKDFSREAASGQRSDVDLNKVIIQATTIISHQIRRHTKCFTLEPAPELPLISGNSQQLEQVLINLVLNALQALPDKDRVVKITSSYDMAGQMACVDVYDQGVGVSGEIAPRIMDTFFTTKRESGGTGLGLSISQSIVRDHNGTLSFVSTPDLGTTFSMRIPVVNTKEVQDK